MSRNTNIFKYLDWTTVVLYLFLILLGWLNVFGASHDIDQTSIFDFAYFSGKQFVWILFALVIAVVILLIDGRVYQSLSTILYVMMILLLIGTIFVAPDIKGSRSWLALGPVRIQPAEFSKFITALALANFMGQYGFKLRGWKNYAIVCLMLLFPMGIIILQNETGSALVYASFMLMLYREGLPGLIPFAALCCIVLFVVVVRFAAVPFWGVTTASTGFVIAFFLMLIVAFIMIMKYRPYKMPISYLLYGYTAIAFVSILLHATGLVAVNFVYVLLATLVATAIYTIVFIIKARCKQLWLVVAFIFLGIFYSYSVSYVFNNVFKPHQQSRIEVLLGMKYDPKGAGYNVEQAKIAIGSGGLFGKGYLNGTQTTLKFVPEQHTDFIFCTVGEEFGFLGSVFLLGLYLFLLLHLMHMAESQHEAFSRIYGYCVVGIFLFHIIVNIGMVIGLMPVIGIPLPFFSYGGSSMWSFTILLFIFLRLDMADKQHGRN